MVGRQPHAPAAFIWYSFLEAESVATEKIPSVTPPVITPETFRLVAQCLNRYATPGPTILIEYFIFLRIAITLTKAAYFISGRKLRNASVAPALKFHASAMLILTLGK
jgi:hypothetical protein